MEWGHAKNDHRSHIKGKHWWQTHSLNCSQSWHMGTTNKLLQKALWKWTHSSRQPEAAILINRQRVGENGLGFYRLCHYYQIIQEVLYQQWKMMYCGLNSTWVRLQGALLVLETSLSYMQVYMVLDYVIFRVNMVMWSCPKYCLDYICEQRTTWIM